MNPNAKTFIPNIKPVEYEFPISKESTEETNINKSFRCKSYQKEIINRLKKASTYNYLYIYVIDGDNASVPINYIEKLLECLKPKHKIQFNSGSRLKSGTIVEFNNFKKLLNLNL